MDVPEGIQIQPALPDTPRGNQATDEGEPRCFDQRVFLSLGTQLCNFLYRGQCDCLKVSLDIVKDLCNIDLTPIVNFKYCFTIENK